MAEITLSGIGSSGVEPLSYQWKDSNGNVIGSLVNQVVTSPDTYSLTVTDNNVPKITSQPIYWVVTTESLPDVNISSITDVLVNGGTIRLTAEPSGLFYKWYKNNYLEYGTTEYIDVTTSGYYTVEVSNDTNSTCTGTAGINISDAIQVSLPVAEITSEDNGILNCNNNNNGWLL